MAQRRGQGGRTRYVPDPVEREVIPHTRRGQGGRRPSANATSSAAITASAGSGQSRYVDPKKEPALAARLKKEAGEEAQETRNRLEDMAALNEDETGPNPWYRGSGTRSSQKTSPAGVDQTGTDMGFNWDKFNADLGVDVRNPFTSVQLPETESQFNPALSGNYADAFTGDNALGEKYANIETMQSANEAAAQFDWGYGGTEIPFTSFETQLDKDLIGKYAGKDGLKMGFAQFDKETPETEQAATKVRGRGLRNDGLPGRRGRSGVNDTDFARDYGESMTSAPMTDERRRQKDAFLNAEDSMAGIRASQAEIGRGYAGGQHMLRTGDGKDDYVTISAADARAHSDGRKSAQELKDEYVSDLVEGRKVISSSSGSEVDPETSGKLFPSDVAGIEDNGLQLAGPQRENSLLNWSINNNDPVSIDYGSTWNDSSTLAGNPTSFDPLNKGIEGTIWS